MRGATRTGGRLARAFPPLHPMSSRRPLIPRALVRSAGTIALRRCPHVPGHPLRNDPTGELYQAPATSHPARAFGFGWMELLPCGPVLGLGRHLEWASTCAPTRTCLPPMPNPSSGVPEMPRHPPPSPGTESGIATDREPPTRTALIHRVIGMIRAPRTNLQR